jgi:hypothetical protein
MGRQRMDTTAFMLWVAVLATMLLRGSNVVEGGNAKTGELRRLNEVQV